MAELTLDREYHAKGIQLLCGVDEAGRGRLAGRAEAPWRALWQPER